MNVVTIQRTKCSGCGHISTERKVGDICEKPVETISLGTKECNGIYSLTNGEKFKQQFGYSKSMKRNMKRNNVQTVEEYRKLRASKRKANKKVRPVKLKPESSPSKKSKK